MKTQRFETIVIINDKLDDPQYDLIVEDYRNIIKDLPSKSITVDKMGKKKLAYDIRGHKEGYYVIFTYFTLPTNIYKLEDTLRKDKQIFKYMTLKHSLDDGEEKEDDILTSILTSDDQDISEQPANLKPIKKPVDVFDLIYGINQEEGDPVHSSPAETKPKDDGYLRARLFEVFDTYKYADDIDRQLKEYVKTGNLTMADYNRIQEKYNEWLAEWEED